MSMLDKIKLALRAKRAVDAIEQQTAAGLDWRKTLAKGGIDFVLTSGAVLAAFWGTPEGLAQALGFLPDELRVALIPVASALLVMLRNAIKHWAASSAEMAPVQVPVPPLTATGPGKMAIPASVPPVATGPGIPGPNVPGDPPRGPKA